MEGIWRQWWRVGGVAAIGFVILFVIGGIGLQFDVPEYDASIEDIRSYWVDDGQKYLAGDYLIALGFVLFYLPFIAGLRSLLGRAEGGVNLWSRVAFIASLVIIILGAAGSAAYGTLAFGDVALEAGDDTLLALMLLSTYAFTTMLFAMAAFALAASLVILQTGVLWRWLGYLGVIEAVFAVLAPFHIFSSGTDNVFTVFTYVAVIGILVWILLVGVAMVMREEEPAAAM